MSFETYSVSCGSRTSFRFIAGLLCRVTRKATDSWQVSNVTNPMTAHQTRQTSLQVRRSNKSVAGFSFAYKRMAEGNVRVVTLATPFQSWTAVSVRETLTPSKAASTVITDTAQWIGTVVAHLTRVSKTFYDCVGAERLVEGGAHTVAPFDSGDVTLDAVLQTGNAVLVSRARTPSKTSSTVVTEACGRIWTIV